MSCLVPDVPSLGAVTAHAFASVPSASGRGDAQGAMIRQASAKLVLPAGPKRQEAV